MPLPLSKNQVRNLGKRLRDAPTPEPADLDLLAEVLAAYGDALGAAGECLIEEGLDSSERLKITGTIVEKLRRNHAANLPGIQDIAGRRIVLPPGAGRVLQDETVDQILRAFASADRPPRVDDRRLAPSRGYRAVHVVVDLLDLPVEIQVRTAPQHEWAEYFERLADVWGRAVRYEDGLPDIGRLLVGRNPEVAELFRSDLEAVGYSMIEHALVLGDVIDAEEQRALRDDEADVDHLEIVVARHVAVMRELMEELQSVFERLG